MNTELNNLLLQLLSYKSISDNLEECKKCINFCIKYFTEQNLNIYVKEIEVKGVSSVLFTNTENCLDLDIMEIGHIDVVPATEQLLVPEIKDNIIYGRGVGDMKGFVAVAMKMFEYMIKNNIGLKCGLLIVSDEEPGGFLGAKYWSEEIKLKTKILFEADSGGKTNKIVYKNKGCFIARVVSKGISAHGSKPWFGDDANEKLIVSLQKLRKFFPYYSNKNVPDDYWVTTMHVAEFNGGDAINSVANYAVAVIDIRYTEEWSNESIIKTINSNLEDGVELIVDEYGIPIYNDPENKYLKEYKKTIEDITKQEAIFAFEPCTGDSRYFINTNKDTLIISNQSDCGDLHGEKEWLDLKKLSQFLEIRKTYIDKFIKKELNI